jgi:hypothetical protein
MESVDSPEGLDLCLRVHWSVLGVLHLLVKLPDCWLDLLPALRKLLCSQCSKARHILIIYYKNFKNH